MKPWIVILIILVIVAAAMGALYYFGNKAQKKQEEQRAQLEAMKQTIPMLIIDKKRMRMNEAGLPQQVLDATPKRFRRAKLPIVKAKVGPKIMTMICEEEVFDMIPLKKEVKATVSGIYILGVRGMRGSLPVQETAKKKNGFFQKLLRKARGEEK